MMPQQERNQSKKKRCKKTKEKDEKDVWKENNSKTRGALATCCWQVWGDSGTYRAPAETRGRLLHRLAHCKAAERAAGRFQACLDPH